MTSAGDPPPAPADLEALLVRHLPAVEGYLRLRMGPVLRTRESAVDLAQSVAREALVALPEFEFRGEGAFRAWLFARAHHKLQERVRHHQQGRRDARLDLPFEVTEPAATLQNYRSLMTPSAELSIAESVRAIEAAFDELPEDWQEAILLHRMGGLSHAEVGAQLGRSEGAVRNLVYRGLSRLAVRLDIAASQKHGARAPAEVPGKVPHPSAQDGAAAPTPPPQPPSG